MERQSAQPPCTPCIDTIVRRPCWRRDAAKGIPPFTICTDMNTVTALQARWHEASQMLRAMGFEVGWGSTVGRVKESMHELLDILQVCC